MANTENLRPVRTKSEARKRGRNGGIESGKSRRRAKTYRELVRIYESSPLNTSEQAKLKALGFADEDLCKKAEVVAAQHQAAKEGSTKAATWLRETEEGKLTEHISAEVAEVKPLVDLTKRKKNGEN